MAHSPQMPTLDELMDTSVYRPVNIHKIKQGDYYISFIKFIDTMTRIKITSVDEPRGSYFTNNIDGDPNVKGGYNKAYYELYNPKLYEKIPDIERLMDFLGQSRRDQATSANMYQKKALGIESVVKTIASNL